MDQLTNFVSKSFMERDRVLAVMSEPYSNKHEGDFSPRSVPLSRASSVSPNVDPEDSTSPIVDMHDSRSPIVDPDDSSHHDSPLRLTMSPSGSHRSDKGKK